VHGAARAGAVRSVVVAGVLVGGAVVLIGGTVLLVLAQREHAQTR
jgi:hypothetical protein